ncbi:hypothetical protein LEP1GSC188_0273 [Leptospira weilii serovar Topaz str. LT2116]|uniref:Uncharacterized protein n=1 Tax=Leptospira weilii serovar Topaz str. LT2116 TaxID=1088540 RepID=M3EGW3_9LEPT|nr:hypothetical protein LEP1GSC188_0273 [Leptospira weilii serovar Topaz str. LT2116]
MQENKKAAAKNTITFLSEKTEIFPRKKITLSSFDFYYIFNRLWDSINGKLFIYE